MTERQPKNRMRTRDYFRWDERHHQPHSDMSQLEKLWVQRSDAGSLLALIGRNLRHAAPVVRGYRHLAAAPDVDRAASPAQLGIAVSPTAEDFDRTAERVRELGAGSVLVRIPHWQPEPVWALAQCFADLRATGVSLVFDLLQDRAAATDPARWGAFVAEAAERLGHLAPAFQIGHAVNRKKWGIWHPAEYHRMLEATAPVRGAHREITWLGPAVIDFEYHVTLSVLAQHRPFDFDGVSALLYVDRRGSPEAVQYRHFDLRRKLVLLEAIIAASGHGAVPVWLTEFNWPLSGTGAHNPAGQAVAVDEERQASYLTLYALHALAAVPLAGLFWWQMVARGYGLCDDDPSWRRRPAFLAFKNIARQLAGGATVRALMPRADGLRGFVLRRNDSWTIELHVGEGQVRVRLPNRPGEVVAVGARAGVPVAAVGGENEWLIVTPDPVFLTFDPATAAAVLAEWGLAAMATRAG